MLFTDGMHSFLAQIASREVIMHIDNLYHSMGKYHC